MDLRTFSCNINKSLFLAKLCFINVGKARSFFKTVEDKCKNYAVGSSWGGFILRGCLNDRFDVRAFV